MACAAALGPFQPMIVSFFVLKLIGRFEELFKLLSDRLRKIAHVFQGLLRVRISRNGEHAVVTLGLSLVLLLDLKNADDPASEDNAREGRGSPSSALVEGTNPQSCG